MSSCRELIMSSEYELCLRRPQIKFPINPTHLTKALLQTTLTNPHISLTQTVQHTVIILSDNYRARSCRLSYWSSPLHRPSTGVAMQSDK